MEPLTIVSSVAVPVGIVAGVSKILGLDIMTVARWWHSRPEKAKGTVFLSGVRHGVLEAPEIYLWDKPEGQNAGAKVVDNCVVKSRTPVG